LDAVGIRHKYVYKKPTEYWGAIVPEELKYEHKKKDFYQQSKPYPVFEPFKDVLEGLNILYVLRMYTV
jgi:hypothetical protein